MSIKELLALHTGDTSTDMVYEVWNDGEVTLTKGDDLYGQRNLHCIKPGFAKALPVEALHKRYSHSRIIVKNYEDAEKARELIRHLLA